MNVTQKQIIDIIHHQLVLDFNCDLNQLINKGNYFCEATIKKGQRPFERQSPYLQIATINESNIIIADKSIMSYAKEHLINKSREDLFAAPFLFGHSIWYIPDLKRMSLPSKVSGFNFKFYYNQDVFELYQYLGFDNALQYDIQHPCPDVIALVAYKDNDVVAIAGASQDSDLLWQVGMDVLPQYRRYGLATYLISHLSHEIFNLGKIPYYCTASSNIPSQRIAHYCGYMPYWTTTYHHIFDKTCPYYSLLKEPLINE